MSLILLNLFKKNPILVGLSGIGPLLLLSNRLVYSLTFSVVLIVYSGIMLLFNALVQRFLEPKIQYGGSLFLAATIIALLDMILTVLYPFIRADIGILLPLMLASTYFCIFPWEKGEDRSSSDTSSEDIEKAEMETRGIHNEVNSNFSSTQKRILALIGCILGYILVFNLLAVVRELLAYGQISFSTRPWEGAVNSATPFILMSGAFGLLLILSYVRAVFRRFVK